MTGESKCTTVVRDNLFPIVANTGRPFHKLCHMVVTTGVVDYLKILIPVLLVSVDGFDCHRSHLSVIYLVLVIVVCFVKIILTDASVGISPIVAKHDGGIVIVPFEELTEFTYCHGVVDLIWFVCVAVSIDHQNATGHIICVNSHLYHS